MRSNELSASDLSAGRRRSRWLKGAVLELVRFYQRALSPALPPSCRFLPSCSDYCLEAVELHGVHAGLLLSVRRVARCHPFHPGGFDPVPARPGS